MKKMDEVGLKLCNIQAEVFRCSATEAACSSPVFMRRFMNSGVAQRMDQAGFLSEACDTSAILEEIEQSYGPTQYGKDKYGLEELFWIGYIYRYWCYTYEKSSKQVYRIIKPKKLRELYFPYHSLDPAQAIERIMEAENKIDEDYTQRGVEILRKIMQRNEQ